MVVVGRQCFQRCLSVHDEGGVCLVPGMLGPRSLPGSTCTWSQVPLRGVPGTPLRQVYPQRVHSWKIQPSGYTSPEGSPPRRYNQVLTFSGGHRSGWVASYWNSVLLWLVSLTCNKVSVFGSMEIRNDIGFEASKSHFPIEYFSKSS